MITPIMEEKNYSKCPLKKRPVNLSFENEDTDLSDHEIREEPENLTVKKEVVAKSPVEVAIKHEFKHELNNNDSFVQNQNTPLVVMPTPTYPNLALRPWSFHIPYTPDFYRNIHHPQPHPLAAYQSPPHPISPLRGDLHSPSSPSEGSISPPPSYLHGRSSSLSPPIRTDVMYPAMMARNSHVIKPEVVGTHRFIPYQLPAYKPYELNLSQQSPVSPSYSERSFFSMRSHSPDSNCSTPEDLSVKSLSTSPAHYSHHNHHSHHSSHSSPVSSSTSVSSLLPEISDRRSVSESREKSSSKSGPPRHQCQDCNKSYSTFSGLTKHRQFHCPAAEGNQVKKSFSCKDCDKTYVSLGALKMHIRTHTLPCKCNICGKAFSRPWLLQGHIRTHTGEKPFSCQHCHRAFADRSNLRAHLQTHSDIKKYSCPTCSKTFSRMSLLTKHADGGCPGMQMSPGPALPPFLPPQYSSSSSDRQPQDIVAAY